MEIGNRIEQYHHCHPKKFGYVNNTAYGRIYKNRMWYPPYPLPKATIRKESFDIAKDKVLFLTRGLDPTIADWFTVTTGSSLILVKEDQLMIYTLVGYGSIGEDIIPILEDLLGRKLIYNGNNDVFSFFDVLRDQFGECNAPIFEQELDEEDVDGFVQFDVSRYEPTTSIFISTLTVGQAIEYIAESSPLVCKMRTTRPCFVHGDHDEEPMTEKHILQPFGIYQRPLELTKTHQRLQRSAYKTLGEGILVSEEKLLVPCSEDMVRCNPNQVLYIRLTVMKNAEIDPEGYYESRGHANAILVDFRTRTVERYDPNGSHGELESKIDDRLEAYFNFIYPGFKYIGVIDGCPIFGPQFLEQYRGMPENGQGQLCVAYAALIFHLRILNQTLSGREIMERLSTKRNLYTYVRQYGSFLESLMPTTEQYIAWIKLHYPKEFNVHGCSTRQYRYYEKAVFEHPGENITVTNISAGPDVVIINDFMSESRNASYFIGYVDKNILLAIIDADWAFIIDANEKNPQQRWNEFQSRGLKAVVDALIELMNISDIKISVNVHITIEALLFHFNVSLPTLAQIKELESGDYEHYIGSK